MGQKRKEMSVFLSVRGGTQPAQDLFTVTNNVHYNCNAFLILVNVFLDKGKQNL